MNAIVSIYLAALPVTWNAFLNGDLKARFVICNIQVIYKHLEKK